MEITVELLNKVEREYNPGTKETIERDCKVSELLLKAIWGPVFCMLINTPIMCMAIGIQIGLELAKLNEYVPTSEIAPDPDSEREE